MIKKCAFLAAFMLLLLLFIPASAEQTPEITRFKKPQEAVDYAKANQPAVLNLGDVSYTPTQLLSIQRAMPAEGKLLFSLSWMRTIITPESETINLNGSGAEITLNDMLALMELAPKAKTVDLSKHRSLKNAEMAQLIEQYPNVEFIWIIRVGTYSVPSNVTAFSTLKSPNTAPFLTSQNARWLRYATHLRALDLGHNYLTDISFLETLTDLELLILGDNLISDISPIANLTKLQYAELFENEITDLTPLASCPRLLDLNIVSNKVADLSPLDGNQYLQRLWASHNYKLTDEAIAHFHERHPDCQANFTSPNATAEGWRSESDRYHHYIKVWEKMTWVPFPDSMVPWGSEE